MPLCYAYLWNYWQECKYPLWSNMCLDILRKIDAITMSFTFCSQLFLPTRFSTLVRNNCYICVKRVMLFTLSCWSDHAYGRLAGSIVSKQYTRIKQVVVEQAYSTVSIIVSVNTWLAIISSYTLISTLDEVKYYGKVDRYRVQQPCSKTNKSKLWLITFLSFISQLNYLFLSRTYLWQFLTSILHVLSLTEASLYATLSYGRL